MLGGVPSVTWQQGDTALTLAGKLPLPEVVQVAGSPVLITRFLAREAPRFPRQSVGLEEEGSWTALA